MTGGSTASYYPVHGKIPYGAEYWIEHDADANWFRDDLSAMRRLGFNCIRIFVSSRETAPDVHDYAQLDALFAVAAETGIQICPTLTHRLAPWRAEAFGYDPNLHVQVPYLLDDPNYCAQLRPGLEHLVARYRGHPALWSWILWNEPMRSNTSPPPPPTWRLFLAWLGERYGGDLDAMNRVWFPEHESGFAAFDAIRPQDLAPEWYQIWREDGPGDYTPVHPRVLALSDASWGGAGNRRWTNAGALRDWIDFNVERMTANIRWLAEVVRAVDADTPTHVNPAGMAQNQAQISRDLPAIARAVDILGASLHAGHHFSLLDAEVHFAEAFSYYTQRIVSANKGGHSVLTELQGGANTWSGNKNFCPDGDDLIQWNLVALGQGVRGVIYWLWRPRFYGWEGGEWGLMGGAGQPTPKTEGAGIVGRLLEDHGEWLGRLQPAPARAAILHSHETEIVALREDGRQHKPSTYGTISEYGCYRALWRAGIPAELVTSDEVHDGVLGRFRVLFIPYAEAMDPETGAAIADFVRRGGWLYAETPLANKDARGSAYPISPGAGLREVLPTTLDMWPARVAPTLDSPFGPLHSAAFIQPLEPQGATANGRALAVVREHPVAWEGAVGEGRVRFLGTCLTLYAGQHDDADAEFTLLAEFARGAGAAPDWSVAASGPAPAYRLEDHDGQADAMLLVNEGAQPNAVEVRLPYAPSAVDEVLLGLPCTAEDHVVRLTLPPRRGAVLRLRR